MTKKVTIYQYSKCGTCREAVKHLKRNGYELESVELFEKPPSAQQLAQLILISGLTAQQFFNVNGDVYREMNLKDKAPTMSYPDKIALMSSNGRLIRRPIVTDGNNVTVGYKASIYDEVWS